MTRPNNDHAELSIHEGSSQVQISFFLSRACVIHVHMYCSASSFVHDYHAKI